MRFMEVVNDFAQLSRIYLAPFTVSIPILGALTVNPHLTIGNLFALGMVGLSAHIFGFSLNDAIDYSLDKATTSRQSRPLITGRISLLSAWLFAETHFLLAARSSPALIQKRKLWFMKY